MLIPRKPLRSTEDSLLYTTTLYEQSPLERPVAVEPAGTAPGTVYRETRYGVETNPTDGDGRQILTGTFQWTKTRDEASTNGRTTGLVTRTFADGFGQTRATVAGYGTSSAATTLYDYDAAGNLTKVSKPMSSTVPGDTVGYAYDKRGLLKRRSSSDGGTTRYRYNAAGSVVATQDANRAAAGEVVYTTYDGLGRPLVTGTATGVSDVSAVTETAVAGYPSAQPGSRRHLRVYDAAPSGAPWTGGGSVPALANTAGRLAAEAYRGAGGAAWRVTFCSYNAQGQVEQKTVDAPGLSRQEFPGPPEHSAHQSRWRTEIPFVCKHHLHARRFSKQAVQ